jgi:capsular polysaccharide transport system permease protein
LSEDRNPRREEAGSSGLSGVGADTVATPDDNNPSDQRRREKGSDSQLSRRERVNLARAPLDRRIEQRLTVLPVRQPAKERRVDTEHGQRVVGFPVQLQRRIRPYAQYVSFFLAVVLPIVAATVYYGWFASNQYVAEFRFAVNDTTPTSTSMGSSLMAVLGGGSGSAPLENYMVADYLTSRQAIEELQVRIKVRSLYERADVDWWARFNPSDPMEKFVTYWQKMVTSNYDLITGIATAQVRAFTPEDALLIANSLVKLSEELVNRIANRSNIDAVHFAEKEVLRAQDRLKTVRGELTAYRNKVGVIDPTTSVVASNSTVQTALQGSLATLETQLSSLLGRNLLSTSPAVQSVPNQIKATKDQLAAIEATVAAGAGKDRAGGSALSKIVGDYEQLSLEVGFATAMVTSTMQALEQARAMAASQHLYITPYVRPSLPESSIYPRRFLSVFVVGLLAFAFWVIGLLMVRSIRERFG